MTKQLSTQDIVKRYCASKKESARWKELYAWLLQSINQNTHRILRTNNTLFLIELGAPHEAEVFVINAEPYKQLFKNLEDFCKAMEKAGFKKVWAETEDINLLHLVKRLGYPMTIEKVGTGQNDRVLYRGTVNV